MEAKIISSTSVAGICGIISICICVVFFVGTFLWTLSVKKNYLKHMEVLPLDGGEKKSTDNNQPA